MEPGSLQQKFSHSSLEAEVYKGTSMGGSHEGCLLDLQVNDLCSLTSGGGRGEEWEISESGALVLCVSPYKSTNFSIISYLLPLPMTLPEESKSSYPRKTLFPNIIILRGGASTFKFGRDIVQSIEVSKG